MQLSVICNFVLETPYSTFKIGFEMRSTYQSLDSSVGRAGDCRGNSADISRSLVQIRFEGDFFSPPNTLGGPQIPIKL